MSEFEEEDVVLPQFSVAGTVVRAVRFRAVVVVEATSAEHAAERALDCFDVAFSAAAVGEEAFRLDAHPEDGLSVWFVGAEDVTEDGDQSRWAEPPAVTEEVGL